MRENQLGSLWASTSQNPNAPAFKGSIKIGNDEIRIAIWKNKWKQEGERTPDFYIECDLHKSNDSRPASASAGQGTQNRTPAGQAAQGGDGFDDDIPF